MRESVRVVPDDDPGWPLGGWPLLTLVPGAGLLLRRWLPRPSNGLTALRQTFETFCLAVAGFGIVLVFLWPSQSDEPRVPGMAFGLLVLGAVAGVAGRFIEKPLDCTTDRRLAGSYRVRFFARIAFSEAAALFGFVGFFTSSEWWVYPAGAGIAFVGFARAAPTRGNLRRDQESLIERACNRSLVAALSRVPPLSPGETSAP